LTVHLSDDYIVIKRVLSSFPRRRRDDFYFVASCLEHGKKIYRFLSIYCLSISRLTTRLAIYYLGVLERTLGKLELAVQRDSNARTLARSRASRVNWENCLFSVSTTRLLETIIVNRYFRHAPSLISRPGCGLFSCRDRAAIRVALVITNESAATSGLSRGRRTRDCCRREVLRNMEHRFSGITSVRMRSR